MKQMPQIPGYQMIKKLGHGGMADVYLGVQEKLARPVAIKVMDPLLLRDEQFAKRFVKEAQTAAQLAHPNIITIHDVGDIETSDGHYHYIVMEYLEESLNERLKKQGHLPPKEALEIIKRVAFALDYAHKKGFIHRDIKPDNIMFRGDGSVVLVDFGIARAVDSNTQLTRAGISIGTPHYMSPEQCKGEKIDGRSDIYSLGVQLYEILTGEVPYKAENTAGIIIKQIQDPIPQLPQDLISYQPLIDAMMAKDKEMRTQSGQELVGFIDAILTEQDFFPARVTLTTKTEISPAMGEGKKTQIQGLPDHRKKWLISAAIIALVVVGAAAIYFTTRPQPKPIDIETVSPPIVKEQPIVKKVEPKQDPQPLIPVTIPTKTPAKEKTGIKPEIKPDTNPESSTQTEDSISSTTIKSVTILELPLELRMRYNERLQRVIIPLFRPALRVDGQVTVDIRVGETGKMNVQSMDNILDVFPVVQKNRILTLIEMRLNSISLDPPRNKQGLPVKFKWRVTFKVGKFEKSIILVKI